MHGCLQTENIFNVLWRQPFSNCSITSSNIAYMSVMRFKPTERQLKWYKDGGVAIIDQVICSYAQYFVGTRESTFTFRIQEEREMLGFTLEE